MMTKSRRTAPTSEAALLSDVEFLEFYERSVGQVYRYATRLVAGDRLRAEDLVQETYLTLVRQIRAGRREAVDVGWAITTCRSRFLDQLRRIEVEERSTRRSWEPPPTVSEAGAATEALASLPALQRAAMVLRYVDDLPVTEVARLIGRSVHSAESLLSRGRDALRLAYQRQLSTGNG
jgi:RNA polymerase sigma-70 factor (ECF subfamily)